MSPTSAMLLLPFHSHQARSLPRSPNPGAPTHNRFLGFVSGKLSISRRPRAEAAIESGPGSGSESTSSTAARFQEALELGCWSS
ncbi:Peptidase A1 domain-containing protein [Psidium guajava]|nr:Peptidase A1 domain-containing protein [Psidium guajava]